MHLQYITSTLEVYTVLHVYIVLLHDNRYCIMD